MSKYSPQSISESKEVTLKEILVIFSLLTAFGLLAIAISNLPLVTYWDSIILKKVHNLQSLTRSNCDRLDPNRWSYGYPRHYFLAEYGFSLVETMAIARLCLASDHWWRLDYLSCKTSLSSRSS